AKSIMDYIFRWLELRFVSGQQYTLFENLRPPVQAAAADEARVAQPPSAVGEDLGTTPPKGALAPEATASSYESGSLRLEDRGLYHASDALKELVDMGDAPSCHVCGAIMTRNGSCYRCMSCGSTSGCS